MVWGPGKARFGAPTAKNSSTQFWLSQQSPVIRNCFRKWRDRSFERQPSSGTGAQGEHLTQATVMIRQHPISYLRSVQAWLEDHSRSNAKAISSQWVS